MKFIDNPDIEEGIGLNAFYKKLLDQVPDLIFSLMWKEDDLYSVVYISETINEIYELTVDQLKSDPDMLFRERFVAQDIEPFIDSLEESRDNLAKWDHRYRVMLPKKGLRWMHVTAVPEKLGDGTVIYYGRVTDITDLKQQEERLNVSEERFKVALLAASEGMWDWNMADKVTYFSEPALKMLGKGYSASVMPQSFWSERVHPDDVKHRDIAKRKGLKKGSTYECIYRIRTDEGKYRWILSRGKAVEFDERGKPTRAIGIHKDVTLLKEKEIELANTISIIGDQNNRLRNFAHIVSHNLRSHASNLKMLLDLFKNAGAEEREEMLTHLEAISDGLTITISHLKDLVEIQTEIRSVKRKLNLRQYLKYILNILHNEIKKHGVNIEINIPLDVTVNYNPAYLESMLLNFTTNAIKYSNPEKEPLICYDFEISEGKKILSISDNGVGIDMKKHKNSLFGMYKTFHKNQNARGIGLFITKNQVEAMGGSIEVTSELNKGTTFKVYFNEED